MSNCEWSESLLCIHCGYQARKPGTRRQCGIRPPSDEPISVMRRASRYAAAMARWIAAGSPARSQERIDAILANHCNPPSAPCEHFANGVCGKCGCLINASPEAWQNKLAMATEACPLSPPKWTADA